MTADTCSPADRLALRVLHLDDDPFELDRVRSALEKHRLACNFVVESVATVDAYRQRLARLPAPELAILDIHVGDADVNGIGLALTTRQLSPTTVILMCSTADDVATIAACLEAGADDFIAKQSDRGELSLRVLNAYRLASLKRGLPPATAADAVGSTPADPGEAAGSTMQAISRRVPLLIASAVSAVHIRGESGSGKEVVAGLFGRQLAGKQPFLKVNCGAIAPSLLESELFGHVKGAFTGAAADKRGLLESASGGWIFLDEVATLSAPAQVALLRALENQEIIRVGSTKPIRIQLRVLSATNEPIEQLIKAGRFRADLWQRLREAEIVVPPLRERPGEITALIEHFCRGMAGGPYTVAGSALEVLTSYDWREGNVRELRNCLRAMTELHSQQLLTPLSIPARIWDALGEKPAVATSAAVTPGDGAAGAATAMAGSGNSRQELTIRWPTTTRPTFDALSDRLLIELTRKLYAEKGKLSLRGLAQMIDVSRSTLSTRFKTIVQQGEIIGLDELSRMVGVTGE